MEVSTVLGWLQQRALPLWSEAGVDHESGGFAECLTLDGAPILDVPKRLRVQARQMYCYAHAHLMGWDGPWLLAARQGYDFMCAHYWHDDDGWIFSVNREGRPAGTVREAYEQAFALFGLAWYYRASGDTGALDWVSRTLGFIDEQLADATHGGLLEAVPDKVPRRQNPHMHLLEAYLALHWATGDLGFIERARELFRLFENHLQDSATGTLGEFFTRDWQPATGETGELVEPGHHFEWVWLLQQYARATADDVSRHQAALYDFAEAHGVDSVDGLAFDGVLRDGSTHDDNKRLWVQTEAIKAQIVQLERGNGAAAIRLDQLLDGMFGHYLQENGTWQDHLHRDRVGFAKSAPASSLYHIFLALAEVLRVKEGRETSPYPARTAGPGGHP